MKNEALMAKVAADRMSVLFGLAKARTLEKNAESTRLARRYMGLARRIGSKYKVEIPGEIRRRICRKCGNFLVPGVNCSVRVASVHGYVAYVCECGAERHIFYKKR